MFQIEFDAQEIETALPEYRYIQRLGSGTFASVHLVAKRDNNEQVALKKISCFGMGEYEKNGVANEARILGSLDHRNIIKVYSCLFDNNEQIMYMFMEYAADGDLTLLIEQARQKKKRIPEATIWKALWDISTGLHYLHQNKIMHRDIKPANIFRSNKCFKVGDMNVSKVMKAGSLATTKTGSPLYTAPEVWDSQFYDEKCDIWSLGVLIYEMCCLKLAFEADSIDELVKKIKVTAKSKTIPSVYSTQLDDVVRRMLEVDPKKRISAQQISKIAQQKLRQQTENEPLIENLLETIIFPQTHQRWINLIPLPPPKTTKKQSNSSQRKKQTSRSKSRTKTRLKSQQENMIENNSNIFVSDRPSIPRNKSRSKNFMPPENQPPTNRLPRVKLPSIHKRNNSSIEKNGTKETPTVIRKKSKSIQREKQVNQKTRDSSSSARINKKLVERYINSAKRLISDVDL